MYNQYMSKEEIENFNNFDAEINNFNPQMSPSN
jgi:hypothetical protein